MNRTVWIAVFLMVAAALPAALYEKYVVPGNPLDDSIIRLQEELKARPDSAELHSNLGVKLWEKRFPKDAIREFKRAVKLDKRQYQAWFNMGLAYEALGQNVKAWRAFRKTIKYKPGHDLAQYHLGMIYERWGLHDAAVRRYAKAITYNQHILDVRYNAAIVYNRILPEVLAVLYDRHQTARVQPFQDLAVPSLPIEPPPAEAATPAEPVEPAPPPPPEPAPTPKQEGIMKPPAAPPSPPEEIEAAEGEGAAANAVQPPGHGAKHKRERAAKSPTPQPAGTAAQPAGGEDAASSPELKLKKVRPVKPESPPPPPPPEEPAPAPEPEQ